MKSREISRTKIGPFSLACTNPYIGIGWEYQSSSFWHKKFIPKELSAPALGLYTCIKSWKKNCIKSDFREIFWNL